MRKTLLIILFIFCLPISLIAQAKDKNDVLSDTILQKRVYEYLELFQDYLKFMTNEKKSANTRLFYHTKALALFSPNALVKISKSGHEIEEVHIKTFLSRMMNQRDSAFSYRLDSIQVPNWENKKLGSLQNEIMVDCKNIAFKKTITYNLHKDSITLCRESTELRDEWRPKLGNLYVTFMQKTTNDEIIQDIDSIANSADSTHQQQRTICQRTEQKHVRCKSKARGRVLQPIQRKGNQKRHPKEKQGCAKEESPHAPKPNELPIEE